MNWTEQMDAVLARKMNVCCVAQKWDVQLRCVRNSSKTLCSYYGRGETIEQAFEAAIAKARRGIDR